MSNQFWPYSLIIFLFAFLLYANTISHDYVLDDNIVTRGNQFVQKGFSGIKDIFTHGYLYGFNGKNDQSYRPLVLANFAIEKQLFNSKNDKPSVHHFFNVLFFAISAVCLFLFLFHLFKKENKILPFIITMLFVAHPIHTEVVANIKSRDEILSFIFLCLSLYALLKYLREERSVFLVGSLAAFLGAVLSKDSGLAMLGLVPFTIYFFTTKDFKKIGMTMLPFLGVTAFYFLIRMSVMDSIVFEKNMTPINNSLAAAKTTGEFLATNIMIHGKYLLLLIFPHPLSYDYSFNQIPIVGFGDWRVLLSLLAYIGIAFVGIRGLWKKEVISYGIIFYVIMMLLTSNFLTMIGATMAERFLFVPSLGFCIVLGYLAYRFFKLKKIKSIKNAPPAFLGLFAIVLLLYSFKTINRNKDWKNAKTLFSSGLKTAPNSARALSSYGTFLREAGEQSRDPNQKQKLLTQALDYYQKALDIYPAYSEVYYNMGVSNMNLGRNDLAQKQYEKTLSIEPKFQGALNNLGYLYFQKKDYASAKKYWEQLLALNPNNASALGNIGAIYHNNKDYNKAANFYERALKNDPNNQQVLGNIVKVYQQLGKTAEAKFYQTKLK